MKKSRPSRSAFTNFRVLFAFALSLAGVSVGASAFGSWSGLSVAGWIGSKHHRASNPKLDAKTHRSADASKSMIPARTTPTSNPVPRTPAPPYTRQNTVKQQANAIGQTVYTISPSHFDVSRPLTELATLSLPRLPWTERPELELPSWRILRSGKPDPVTQVAPRSSGPLAPTAPDAAATGFNFAGISGSPIGGTPPDNNGSVGNNQFVQTVNTDYQVWSLDRANKTATSIAGPAAMNTLWAGFGGACEAQNSGDPVVLYDKVANRWLLSQFTSGADAGGLFYQCVAISKTADATKEYYRFAFAVPDGNGANGGDFGDYPHYGVWPDAYYVMGHAFDNAPGGFSFVAGIFGAMDRTKMLAGDASATWQVILDPSEGGHMPADLDGFAPPPAGAPGIFTSVHPDGMYLYRMKVDFSNAANTTRTLQAKMPIAPVTFPCGGTAGQCIPQPQSPLFIDSVGDRLMFRLAYRNFIDHESLVVSHSVDPGIAGVVSGVRWYEFRISGQPDNVCGTYPCTYQQGTIADAPNGRSRWMPSISQDGAGNMIVGYSATGTINGVDNHSIRYTGRASNHPLGTMTVPETIIFTGQSNIVSDPTAPVRVGRWGDYTSTSIDPADDCTFWHVNEYYGLNSAANFDWRTRIASVNFSPTQCQPSTCTTRPASAPTGVAASPTTPNQIQVTWTAVAPAPGSYAIERAVGAVGSEGPYQPLTFVPGSATSYIDNAVQGGVTYSYRVIAATDSGGRCQALVHSAAASATGSGDCNLKPGFTGAISATSLDGPACGITLNWTPADVRCPLKQIRYNIYRGTTPDFVPSPATRVASCVPGPSSYVDVNSLTSGITYYYVVRAEDTSTGHGGACGGNEEANSVVVAGTAYGSGAQAGPGIWTDGGGDGTSFLRLNVGAADAAWRIVRNAEDPGANHTPGGDFAYRNTGPDANAVYGDLQCASAETPVLTVADTTVNLTYWERHQFEAGWDGIAIEYSRNGGAWTDLPAPSNSTGDGCMSSDVTSDYATLACTADPPVNACGYPSTKPVITGPRIPPDPAPLDCTASMTGALTNYARRCHRLTGLTAGDTIKFRWVFTSDPATTFKGFYLDDIAVTNIKLPNACNTAVASPTPTATATATASPVATATATASPTATPSASPKATPTAPPTVTQAINLSTRMRVDAGDNAGIGGFIITGNNPKHVIIRGLGPSLTKFGFSSSEVLADPTLELHGPSGFATVINNDWKDSQQASIQAAGLAPENDLESALDMTLAPGNYTAIVRGRSSTPQAGIALVEVYDLAPAASKLANLSTRAFVGTANNVVIGGFILGNGNNNTRVVVRGLGPSLSQFGVPNPLQDPTLELRDQNGILLRSNNDWQDDPVQAGQIAAAGLAPTSTKESAIAATLSPGSYTAILAGQNNGTGVGLVEVYDRGP
jgi:hypothetical protein